MFFDALDFVFPENVFTENDNLEFEILERSST